MFRSLKNRLLAWFLLVTLIVTGIIFSLNYFHEKRISAINQLVFEVHELHSKFLKDFKLTSDFLSCESTNTDFFITGESPYLNKHYSLRDSLLIYIDKLSHNSRISGNLDRMQYALAAYHDYCTHFDSLVYYIYKRGYRDFGLEGEMISYIYKAEKNHQFQNCTYNLRKYEREYLNRNEIEYAEQLLSETHNLKRKVRNHPGFSPSQKEDLSQWLIEYETCFIRLLALDEKLGLKTNTGFKAEFNKTGDKLEKEIIAALADIKDYEHVQKARLNSIFGIFSVVIFLIAILISLYVSRHLMNDLEQLTNYIAQIAENNFSYNGKLKLRKSTSEIRKIYKEFRNMIAQLKIREMQRDNALLSATKSEKRYRELTDLLPQSVFETDDLGNLVYVNKAWYTNFGFSHDDILQGLNLIEILMTDNQSNLTQKPQIINPDYLAIRKDGTKFPAQVYYNKILENEKHAGKRGIIIDATLRKKYIETLKKKTKRAIVSDQYKSFFLANMSHEIRTPMNSIIGFTNLLSMEQIPDTEKQEFINYIQSSGQILLNLIDDIIDIAKIEAGEIKIKNVPCNPIKIINELINTFEGYKFSIGKENIKLNVYLPATDIFFIADPFRLRQVLSNLISNALKYTEKGSVTIELNAHEKGKLIFSVTDTGIGLKPEELETIFKRFRRTKASEKKNISGAGLGLAISKNLVELMEGQLHVLSESGKGTRFWFELPYIQVPGVKSNAIFSSHESLDEYQWAQCTILIVEDDDSSFYYLKELLKVTQAMVIRAKNGAEAIELVKQNNTIDAILMDIQLPVMDGYKATEKIKELRPHLPVIAQTANAMEGDKEKCILSGCDDYIAKPIHPQQLLDKIDQFLETPPEKGINHLTPEDVCSEKKNHIKESI